MAIEERAEKNPPPLQLPIGADRSIAVPQSPLGFLESLMKEEGE